jgi:O-6-methylguanine DNA methyltransferase
MAPTRELTRLQQQWNTLLTITLPGLAKSKDPAQQRWPVQLDHCFARIILDNTVGEGNLQWDQVIGKPAVQNMSDAQFRSAIRLGEQIRNGEANLVELDERSLAARGKPSKRNDVAFKSEEGQFVSKKRKSHALEVDEQSPKKTKIQSTLSFGQKEHKLQSTAREQIEALTGDLMPIYERVQSHPTLTPYRKRLYAALLTVPRGHYTTYAAMSDYLRSSARAVGNGMRNNPFAPEVPCHRVLAADGSIGGFRGDWGKEGQYANDKIELLKKEGVEFDSRGKVKGQVWRGFYELTGGRKEEG